jgi:hypothetical protein
MPRAGGRKQNDAMSELTDKQITDFLPMLGYFAAQGDYYGRVHVCKERDGLRAVGFCGQVADVSAPIRKGSSFCGTCRRVVVRKIRAAQKDNDKLEQWKKASAPEQP